MKDFPYIAAKQQTIGNKALTWQLVRGNTCQAAFALGYAGHLQGRTPSPSMRTYPFQSECTMLEEKDGPGTAISPFQFVPSAAFCGLLEMPCP